MLVKFLNPAKFPNIRAKNTNVGPTLTFSNKTTSIALNMALYDLFKTNLPNPEQVQILHTEPIKEEEEIKYYIFPCRKEGFELKFKTKASSCHFASKGLRDYFIEKLKIPENISIFKITIADTISRINDISCFEIMMSDVEKIEKPIKN